MGAFILRYVALAGALIFNGCRGKIRTFDLGFKGRCLNRLATPHYNVLHWDTSLRGAGGLIQNKGYRAKDFHLRMSAFVDISATHLCAIAGWHVPNYVSLSTAA